MRIEIVITSARKNIFTIRKKVLLAYNLLYQNQKKAKLAWDPLPPLKHSKPAVSHFGINQIKQKCIFTFFDILAKAFRISMIGNYLLILFIFSKKFLDRAAAIFRRNSRVAPENGRGSVQKRFFEKIKRIISRYTYPKDILNVLAKNSKKCARYIFAYADWWKMSKWDTASFGRFLRF